MGSASIPVLVAHGREPGFFLQDLTPCPRDVTESMARKERIPARAFLTYFASSRGKALMALLSLGLAFVSFAVPRPEPGVFAAALTATLAGVALHQKSKLWAGAFIGCVILFGLVAFRDYVRPGTTSFFYGGQPMGSDSGPFAQQEAIPLTDNPLTGRLYTTVAADGGPTTLEVSCMRVGRFERSNDVLWVAITGGDYKSLWVPWSYLTGMAPGSAHALLLCDDWRWRVWQLNP